MQTYRNGSGKSNVIQFPRWRRVSPKWPCNLCGKRFKRHSRFERFCEDCKHENELYRFSGWICA